jgi:hypothetical protein
MVLLNELEESRKQTVADLRGISSSFPTSKDVGSLRD